MEDLSYENIDPTRFRAELVGFEESPQYKQEGFFIFSNLREGQRTLRVSGMRFQPETLAVTVPARTSSPLFVHLQGDDELIVIVRSRDDAPDSNGRRSVQFDPVILTRTIRAGAVVLSNSLPPGTEARLATTLEAGTVTSARLENADAIAADSIIRIIRNQSIRVKFDPYYIFQAPPTRIVGKVTSQSSENALRGARVRVTHLNGSEITGNDISGAEVFTGRNVGDSTIVLGTEKDISAVTNEKGDYNLYFSNELVGSLTITDETLENLETEGVPEEVRTRLRDLRDQVFRGQQRFLLAVREALGEEDASRYGSQIQEHAESFIRNVTVEAVLEGYATDSRTELISTGQRRVVDFALAAA